MQQQFALSGKYSCDNGNKEVTAFPPRDIVYKQDKQLQDLGISQANPRGPIYELDPEIERTRRELQQRARVIMQGNNGQNPIDGQEQPRQNPPAQAEDLEGLNPAVTILEFEAEHFELKPVMFNMLNTLGQFGGSPAENARQHLKSFLEICNSFKIHGVSNDVLKLKLFPYSLTDKAKAWLNNLPPGSLRSWTDLCRSFLGKFSYSNISDHLQNQITSFRQEDDEAMHEAWERYRDLFRRCPMHGLPEMITNIRPPGGEPPDEEQPNLIPLTLFLPRFLH
ncbi:hypothetical protein V6N11_068046 [Hibiscus sabdariffa]|uniref:Retrotransposon gag domain-containing protein n=1 Tax=Hibiscus sabdariffa TaxID=183260 RepID=A0ABR2STA8_9ROSI